MDNSTYHGSVLVDRTTIINSLLEVQNPSGPCSPLMQYSLTEVADHCDTESCWIVLHDQVYDITEFLHLHPGGLEILLEHAGCDATIAFEDKGHSMTAYKMLEQYRIGELVERDRRKKR